MLSLFSNSQYYLFKTLSRKVFLYVRFRVFAFEHFCFQGAKLVISVNLSKLSCSFIIFYSYIKRFFVNFALKMENGCRFKGDMCCFLRAKCEDA